MTEIVPFSLELFSILADETERKKKKKTTSHFEQSHSKKSDCPLAGRPVGIIWQGM